MVFDDVTANVMTNKRFQTIIKELFIKCRKLNISLIFITQSYFSVPNKGRLNSTHNTLPNNENSQQKRITANCYRSFSRH